MEWRRAMRDVPYSSVLLSAVCVTALAVVARVCRCAQWILIAFWRHSGRGSISWDEVLINARLAWAVHEVE